MPLSLRHFSTVDSSATAFRTAAANSSAAHSARLCRFNFSVSFFQTPCGPSLKSVATHSQTFEITVSAFRIFTIFSGPMRTSSRSSGWASSKAQPKIMPPSTASMPSPARQSSSSRQRSPSRPIGMQRLSGA